MQPASSPSAPRTSAEGEVAVVRFATALLWAMGASTILQFALGSLAPFIAADLGLTRGGLGAITTAHFAVATVCSVAVGPLADRVGGRRVLIVLLVVAGVGLLGVGLGPSLPWLVAAAGVAGIAAAANNPVTNLLIAGHLPDGRRGGVMGVKQSGVQLAALVGGAALPPLAAAAGWRTAMLAAAGGALVGLALVRVGVPREVRGIPTTPPPADEAVSPDPILSGTAALRRTLRGGVAWVAAYALLMGSGVAAVGAFVALYGVEAVGLAPTTAGLVTAVVGGVGVLARLILGPVAERLSSYALPLAWLAAVAAVAQALILAAASWGPGALWLGAVLYGASAGAWNAVANLAVIRIAPAGRSATASGVLQTAFYLGLTLCPAAFGRSVDATGGYTAGWTVMTAIFASAAVLAALWRLTDRPARGGSPTRAPVSPGTSPSRRARPRS